MKKTLAVAVIVGCLLLLANASVAIGTSIKPVSIKKTVDTTLPEIDAQIEEDKNPLSLDEGKNTPPVDGDEQDTISLLIEEQVVNEKSNKCFDIKTRNLLTNQRHQVQLFSANAGGPYSGESGDVITFDGSSCFLGVSYEWDFRDSNDPTPGYGRHPTHSYSVPGTYYAILTVTKSNGETYQDIAPVYIDQEGDHLLPYGGCYYEAEVDEPILFDGSQSSSNGADIVEWVWHFGDGTVSYGEQVSHSYDKEKIYLVTLEVRDSNGNTRQDVLHADIGYTYSSIWDFFVNSDGIIGDILELLSGGSGIPGYLLCDLFFIKMYTNYDDGVQQTERTIDINSFYDFPLSIDVNLDGDDDVIVNNFRFFKPVISESPFNDFPWFAFETTLSDIELTTGSDIKTDNDFTICLQFSLQIIEDFLGLQEPIVRVGYHSAAGEEKPNDFRVTQIFRPYFLFRLLYGGNQQSQGNMNMNTISYPLQELSNNMQSTPQQSMQQQTGQQSGAGGTGSQPLIYGGGGFNPVQTRGPGDISEESGELEGQQYNGNNNPEETWDIITENGVRVESSDVDSFSLLASFSNVVETTRTTLEITFDSFTASTLMHRKGETYRDVDFQGANDNSAMTLSIIRENQYGTATLGILIDPIQNLGFHIDIYKKDNDARHIAFNIDNPPENIVLFMKSEDEQGEETSNYVYMKNMPSSLTFELLPRLINGYISVSREGSEDFKVGITNDLEDPDADIYVSTLPTKETRIDWSILSEDYNTIELSSTTTGLSIHGELKVEDENQEISTVTVDATANSDLDISLQWSILEGYFKLRRSPVDIDFDFSLVKPNGLLDISGNFQGGSDKGFIIDFSGLETGSVEITNGLVFDVTIHAENKETELDTGLLIDTEGVIKLEWDQSVELNLVSDVDVELSDITLSNPDGTITADKILLGGGVDILLNPSEKYYEITSSRYFQIETLAIGYQDVLDFSVESLEMNHATGVTRTSWFDFSSNPKFKIESSRDIDIVNLHLSIGDAVDFDIPSLEIVNDDGSIYVESDDSSLFMDANVDFSWDVTIETQAFGNWEAHGNIEGSGSIDAEWDDGSGSVEFDIDETGIAHTLEIIHDDLTLDLGTFSFDAGTITFEWQREQNTLDEPPTDPRGKFNISNNGVTGALSLCKITYDNQQFPFEFEIGDVTIQSSGDIIMRWQRYTDEKMFYIYNSGLTLNINPVKFTWDGGKTVTLGNLSLNPGMFKFIWDTQNKEIKVKNSISLLGPICSYEDDDWKLSVDLTDLVADYSKTITFKWYKDDPDKQSGIYLDTDDADLVQWAQFEVIKYQSSGDFGRRLTLGGLRADEFEIYKNDNNKIKIEGRLYICNHFTYSKLTGGNWKDLDMWWDLNGDGVGYVEMNSEFPLEFDISAKIGGYDISATFDLTEYAKFAWDIDFDGEGYIFMDSNGDEIMSLHLDIRKYSSENYVKCGIIIDASTLEVDDYMLYWDFNDWPLVIGQSGYISEFSILNDVWFIWNNNWYHIWHNNGPTM